jgi:signal transduction histidine kinase
MAASNPMRTQFAPAERATPGELTEQAHAVRGHAILEEVLSALPDPVLVLNQNRQIVFANRAVLELVRQSEDDVEGMRPGELLGCMHAFETPGGCGTTESCSVCGVVRTILDATHGDQVEGEARLTLRNGDSLDLRARAQRIRVGQEPLTVLALSDIADEKRRRALERVFFHDVLNTAGGVKGLAELLNGVSEEQRHSIVDMLRGAADQLLSEIEAQRLLAAAESHDYTLSLSVAPVPRVLADAVATQTSMARFREVQVEIDPDAPDTLLETDHTLLGRVLGNLIKNAIEASRKGMTVRVSADATAEGVRFRVFNPTPMPRAVELQMFQRSFSTKSPDRGLGTYSVKLFTERYLGGRVSFGTTSAGTTFWVELPVKPA